VVKTPVVVGVEAKNWKLYKDGVFSNCGLVIDHIVLVVGYSGNDYWIIKNSWGPRWGLSGYIHLKGGLSNTCSILTSVFIPIF
jgi:cathepsin L